MSFLSANSASAANSAQGDLSKDVQIQQGPEDSVSEIAFSPQADYLAAGSWDNKVRIWEIQNGVSSPKAMFQHEGPVLSIAWSADGKRLAGAGADKAARLFDTATSQTVQVAAHEQPIRCVKFFQAQGTEMLVTGSWDKTVKYWDLRQQTPAASVTCQERVYTMDVRGDLLVVGTADRYLNIIDMKNPGSFFKTMQSPLKWQTRTVSCFSEGKPGFAVGSIEGRCAIQYIDDADSSSNFSFKCHRVADPTTRDASKVHAVNAISFHPVHGTFSTAGSDGTFHFWDKDAKHRLKGYPEVGGSIVSTAFNKTGEIFAYAVGYDWAKGYSGNNPQYPNKIMLHPVQGDECKPRPGSIKKR